MSNQLTTIPNTGGNSIEKCCRAICARTGYALPPDELAYFRDLCSEYGQAMRDLAAVAERTPDQELVDRIAEKVAKYTGGGDKDAIGALKSDVITDRKRRKVVLKEVADAIARKAMDFAEGYRKGFVESAEEWVAGYIEDRNDSYPEYGLTFHTDPIVDHARMVIGKVKEPLNRTLGRMTRPYFFLPFVDFDFTPKTGD